VRIVEFATVAGRKTVVLTEAKEAASALEGVIAAEPPATSAEEAAPAVALARRRIGSRAPHPQHAQQPAHGAGEALAWACMGKSYDSYHHFLAGGLLAAASA
jgi:hypothetical protein